MYVLYVKHSSCVVGQAYLTVHVVHVVEPFGGRILVSCKVPCSPLHLCPS